MKASIKRTDNDMVKVTTLSSGIAACTLLEIGGISILLDCGSSQLESPSLLQTVQSKLSSYGKTIDAVLISHADMLHLGSLPCVLGKTGFIGTPVICTLPVYKFGQMVLYDYYLNREMEGVSRSSDKSELSSNPISYTLDDVDECMSHVTTVKFSQSIQIHSNDGIHSVTLTAHPSGRTIGGSIWLINYGSTDIVYAMDINLKKEIVLDGVNLDQLPVSPALLITDIGGGISWGSVGGGMTAGINSSTSSTKKKKEVNSLAASVTALISMIMETVRGDGHVILPCETGGRAIELLQQLGSHWSAKNLGMYHLVFLSPMVHNVMEFCQSQLEWMSDSLSRSFYNGKPNPFDLPLLKVCTSVREMEKLYSGPKVVIATDSSLNCGCGKELLLKWGGDPRCRVIFTDSSEPNSLAYKIRTQVPPIFITVTKPIRVELAGEELAAFRAEREEKERVATEENLKRKREFELELLAEAGLENDDTDDEDTIDEVIPTLQSSSNDISNRNQSSFAAMSSSTTTHTLPNTQRSVSNTSSAETVDAVTKKRKLQASLISKFVQPNFVMFESQGRDLAVDEFGASIDDLKFQDVTCSQLIRPSRDRYSNSLKRNLLPATKTPTNSANEVDLTGSNALPDTIPSKLVATALKVQITCGIREFNLGGRAETKGIRTLISKISPARVIVIGAPAADCSLFASQIKTSNVSMDTFAPVCGEAISFALSGDRLRMQVQPELLTCEMTVVRGAAVMSQYTSGGSLGASSGSSGLSIGLGDGLSCMIAPLVGNVVEVSDGITTHGTRLVRLQPLPISTSNTDDLLVTTGSHSEVSGPTLNIPSAANIATSSATISVGEVMLSTLKSKLESKGISVEFRLGGTGGGTLVCGSQVLVRKNSDNEFVLEGPPIAVYFDVRKVLYDHFAFI